MSYDPQQRLESIQYRRRGDRALVEGFHYQYDAAGTMTREIQSITGAPCGERYHRDDAHRVIRVEYGVQDVFDPTSKFEQETSYEHGPEGAWRRRKDVDGKRQLIEEQTATVDLRNRYQQFGRYTFRYDANGNCVRKTSSNPGHWVYAYDQDNRLKKSECYDAQGHLQQTIEYFYDAFGRQVRKVVTDGVGARIEYAYIWAGLLLVEEYENGVLVRSYCYGIGALPTRLSSHQPRRADYTYVFNGRGLASGLARDRDPNAFAEKYGYEPTGASFVIERNGVQIGLPSRRNTVSGLANSILSGDYLKDWASGSHAGSGGTHTDPTIAMVLNSVGNGHGGVMGAIREQLNGYLNMLGRGHRGKGPTGPGKGGLPPGVQLGHRAPNPSLYGANSDGGVTISITTNNASNPAFDFKSPPPTPMKVKSGLDNLVENVRNSTVGKAVVKAIEAGAPVIVPAGANPATTAPPVPDASPTGQPGNGAPTTPTPSVTPPDPKPAAPDPEPAPDPPVEPKPAGPDPDPDPTVMVDPDAASGGVLSELPTAQEIEAKLMQNKMPVNPDSGLGWQGFFPSEGPELSEWDLVSYYDGDGDTGGGGGDGTFVPGGGFTDPVRPGFP